MQPDDAYRHIEVWAWDWMPEPSAGIYPSRVTLREILEVADGLITNNVDLAAIASINADTGECVFAWDKQQGWTKRL